MQQLLVSPAELAAMLGLPLRMIYHRLHANGDLLTVIRLPRFAIVDVHTWVDVKRNACISSIEQASTPARSLDHTMKAAQIAQHQAGGCV